MADLLLPPDIVPNDVEFGIVDGTAVAQSPTVLTVRTANTYGNRVLGCRLAWRNLRTSQRAQLESFIATMRGRANRLFLNDASHALRGSMPTAELLANNTFGNGTTGWTGSGDFLLSVADRVLRATRNGMSATSSVFPSSGATVVQYAPYVARAMLRQGRGTFSTIGARINANSSYGGLGTYGLSTTLMVGDSATSASAGIQNGATSGESAGDYVLVPFISFARCGLVDNSPNLLLRSDEFDNASWTKTASSITANSATDPFGTATADFLVENGATAEHYVSQTVTVPSTATDYCVAVFAKGNTRNFLRLQLQENTGSTVLDQFFNLGTGAIGTNGTTGANWANRRSFIVSYGNSWFLCFVIGRKTNAATSLTANVIAASADGTSSYTGTNGANAINIFRAGLAASSMPFRAAQTTSASSSGSSQSGSGIYTKGWPVSTSGLLSVGDQVELITSQGSELKIVTASLNSDAAGQAYLQFEPGLRVAPADSAPVVVFNPMGKFMAVPDRIDWPTRPGRFSDFTLDLIEAP